jgi:hypothetical protein
MRKTKVEGGKTVECGRLGERKDVEGWKRGRKGGGFSLLPAFHINFR